MRDAIELIGVLIFLVLNFLVRLLWWGFKIIVIVGVIFGAADQILAQAPVSWPQLTFSFRIFSEYLILAFETATRNWLPLDSQIKCNT